MSAAHRNAPPPLTPGEEYRAGCTGKIKQSRQQAQRAAARREMGEAYLCRWCNGWHTSASIHQKLPSWPEARPQARPRRVPRLPSEGDEL